MQSHCCPRLADRLPFKATGNLGRAAPTWLDVGDEDERYLRLFGDQRLWVDRIAVYMNNTYDSRKQREVTEEKLAEMAK